VHRDVSLSEAKQSAGAKLADGGNTLDGNSIVTDENCSRGCQAILDTYDHLEDCHALGAGEAAACPFTVPRTGRAPPALESDGRTAATSELGAYLAVAAHLEAASIHAFVRLERELRAHAAPRRLLRAVRRATMDEVRHARDTAALARSRGA